MPSAATWMQLKITILSEVHQTKTDKYHIISHVESKKKKRIQMNLFPKQKKTHRNRKQTYGYQRGKGDKLGT